MASDSEKQAESVASALAALKKAADSLSETAASFERRPAAPAEQVAAEPQPKKDPPSQRYYQDLQHRGELVDVDDTTDLTRLPPNVTHVRLPDGRVRRLGYS